MNTHRLSYFLKSIVILLLVCISLAGGLVNSHSGATGIVKERMDAMKDMGDKSKIVADMFKGKTELDRNAVADAASAFLMHGKQMAELFPDSEASRTGSNTKALPLIWEEQEVFDERVAEFIELSESLTAAVSTIDDVGKMKKAFLATSKSCSGCHRRYRKPKR